MYDKKIKVTIIIDIDTWKEKEQKILLLEFFKNFDLLRKSKQIKALTRYYCIFWIIRLLPTIDFLKRLGYNNQVVNSDNNLPGFGAVW